MTLTVYHRGGGKSLGYPPNCILTIKWALGHGAQAIEYDVFAVKTVRGYDMAVIEPKLLLENGLDMDDLHGEDVSRIDAGNEKFGACKVAKLWEMLQLVGKTDVHQQIHLKGNNPMTARTVTREIDGLDNIALTSFDLNVLNQVRKKRPDAFVGWLVKQDGRSGSEGAHDLTKSMASGSERILPYTDEELSAILKEAKGYDVDIVILCGPKIGGEGTLRKFQRECFEVGAWGVGSNIVLAKRLMELGVDRFTIDNPEELKG
jgi:glycerophosphoryl diester phosphodiesterase